MTYTDPSLPNVITESPGTVAMTLDGTCNLDKDWKNLTNATSQSDSYADFSDKNFDTAAVSKRLDLTNFGFDLIIRRTTSSWASFALSEK